MPKDSSPDHYELHDEYDLSQLSIVSKGRFAPQRQQGSNIVVLAPDVRAAFADAAAVNAALRLVLQIAKIPHEHPTS